MSVMPELIDVASALVLVAGLRVTIPQLHRLREETKHRPRPA